MEPKKTIAQETRSKLLFTQNKKEKTQIRTEGVKKYIASKYRGAPISNSELMFAAGYEPVGNAGKEYWKGYSFIKGLINRGVIVREQDSLHKPSWRVPELDEAVDSKVDKNLAKPIAQAEVRIVTRNQDDEVPDKPYRVASDDTRSADEASPYSFEITVSKRQAADFGRLRMAQLELTDITLDTARKMLNELLDNIS